MTLAELKVKLAATPLKGTFLRPEFDKFAFGGESVEVPGAHTVLASLNYKVNGPFGNNQKVEVLGALLHVYVDSHRCEDVIVNELNIHNLDNVINDAIGRANAQCDHDYGRELSQAECRTRGIGHYGNCYHVYECSKCQLVYGVDSSD